MGDKELDWKIRYEEMIRQGQVALVHDELARMRIFNLERSDLIAMANIARRVGLPKLTLQLLRPIVRPETPIKPPASPSEIAVYASGLARAGALQESVELLTKIKQHQTPEILLFLGFSYLSQWDYSAAIAPLKKYIKHPDVGPYEATVAKINLASCYQYLEESLSEKDTLLSEILDSARSQKWLRLLRNILELETQAAINQGQWQKAQDFLNEAFAMSDAQDLLLTKWQAILHLKMHGPTPEALENLNKVREQAKARNDWETLRECDFYQALEMQDVDLAAHLYFGTSHRSYKRRLRLAAEAWIKLPLTYTWSLEHPQRVFDLTTGQEIEGKAQLKTGQTLLRLLQFLSSDFYRAFPLGSVFSFMYPGEYYHDESSPARVQRLVERLREWFKENSIPIAVEVENASVRLNFLGPYGLRLAKETTGSPGRALYQEQLSVLKKKWPYQGFSAAQAAEVLATPLPTVRELLKEAEENKKLYRDGQGRATRFRFSK